MQFKPFPRPFRGINKHLEFKRPRAIYLEAWCAIRPWVVFIGCHYLGETIAILSGQLRI